MSDTTDFFLMTPTNLLTAAITGTLDPRSDESTDLFETEENHTTTQQQDEDTEPDYDTTLTGTLDFGPESYLTPRRLVRDCALSLDPPLMPRRTNQHDRNESKRINKEGLKTLHQTASIIIPSIGSKKDNQATLQLPTKTSSFELLPRAGRFFNSPPRLQLKCTLRDTPDSCLNRQNRNPTESKMESHMLFRKEDPLFENIQVNTIKSKPIKRSHSLTAMSAKLESKALRSHVLCCKDGPLFENFQVNTIKVKSMKRSHSLSIISANMESKVLRSHIRKYGSLFGNIQVNTIESKPMERSYSFTAMSA